MNGALLGGSHDSCNVLAFAGATCAATASALHLAEVPVSADSGTRHKRNTIVQKLVLMSVILASIIIPARAARVKNAKVALKQVLLQTALFNLFYLFMLVYVVGRL